MWYNDCIGIYGYPETCPEVHWEVLAVKKATRQTQYKILSIDPWLKPYYKDIALRMSRHSDTRKVLLGDKADLSSFANGYLY